MKAFKQIILFYIIIILTTVCKEKMPISPPNLSVSGLNSINAEIGDTLSFQLSVISENHPSRLTITIKDDYYNESELDIDTILQANTDNFQYYYVIPNRGSEQFTIEFKVIQDDAQEVIVLKNIVIYESPTNSINYSDELENALTTQSNIRCYYSFFNKTSYSPGEAFDISDKINIVYYYSDETGITIASPDDNFVTTITNGTISWSNKNSTRFLKTEIDIYYDLFLESKLIYYFGIVFSNDADSKITNLQQGDVIAFDTNIAGVIGFLKIINFNSDTKKITFSAYSTNPNTDK